MRRSILARQGALLALLLGCQPKAPPATSPEAPGAAPPSAAADRSDPGPTLKHESGSTPAEQLPELSLAAEACAAVGDAHYCEIAMPAKLSELPAGVLARGRLTVRGERYALAVPASEGRSLDRPLAFVRFVGKAPPPASFTLDWLQPGTGHAPGTRLTLQIRTDDLEPREDLDQRFFEAAATWFRGRSFLGAERQDPFSSYAAARLDRLANLARPPQQRRPDRAPRADLTRTMALYSGLSSVEEALQADRGLNLSPAEPPGPTRPLSEIAPVDLPGHPWAEMAAELPGQPRLEPLARVAPADQLYLHFHDLRTLVQLAEEADALLTPVGRILEARSGDRRLAQRYERQLGLERLGLAKTLGHLAAQGVALIAADPFLRDGTAVSVVFHVKTRALLDQALASYTARAKARRPDARETTETIAGASVARLFTEDREIDRYLVELGGEFLAVSNSRAGVEALLAVQADPTLSLSASGEYRYFRLLDPYDPQTEDGYAFLSDAFVLGAVSPRTKILQGRRMTAWSELMAVNQAALLYGWLQGRAARSAKDLTDLKVLDPEQLRHAGGGAIDFDPARGASSKAWGRVDALTPLSALQISQVTQNETAAYERFRETYRNYWRGFIDPIGVRIVRPADGKRLRLDARMMPLIQGSDYNRLARDVGSMQVQIGAAAEGLRGVLAVGADARLRRTLTDLGRATSGTREIGLDWLGDWVMIGAGDRSGLWDAALSLGEVPGRHAIGAYADVATRKRVIDRLPVYVGAHVAEPLALAAGLSALKALVESAAPGMVSWGPSGKYRDVDVVTIQEKLDGDGVSLHYAVVRKVILVTLDRATLEAQIDAVLADEIPRAVPAAKPGAAATGGALADEAWQPQSYIELRPKAGESWLNRTLLGLLEWGSLRAHRAAHLAWEDLLVGLPDLPPEGEARDARILGWLGYLPESPHGGAFTRGPTGELSHALYGSEVEPRWPELPVAGSAATALLAALAELRLAVAFEGEGRTRALRTHLEWRRR